MMKDVCWSRLPHATTSVPKKESSDLAGSVDNTTMSHAEPGGLPAEFVTRLTASQGALYAYIVSLMGGLDQANDVLQETNLKLCRKAALYDAGQPFLRWAYVFARNEVLSWRTRQARSRLVFQEELMVKIADLFESVEENAERELTALERCVEKLPPRQRDLVAARYGRGEPVQEIAARLQMAENAASAVFYRLRKALAACVELTLGKEASL
jgi:RNA polymerase sigma-70 factor, ECF subfamily